MEADMGQRVGRAECFSSNHEEKQFLREVRHGKAGIDGSNSHFNADIDVFDRLCRNGVDDQR